MTVHVTAQPRYDGTFSIDAVAAAGHSRVDQLHDEAMATIAALAENWDQPADEDQPPTAVEGDEPTTWSDPATWSVDEDDEDEDDAEIRVLQPFELPALLRPRQAGNVTTVIEGPAEGPVDDAAASAGAVTDEFAVPARAEDDRQFVAV
jgi:hypothetical protein